MLRNIIVVLKGTVAAQVISVALVPVLTRLLGPDAFGEFQLYQSLLVPLLVLICLRYEIAILQAEEGPELSALLHLCMCVALMVGLLVFLLGGAVVWMTPLRKSISAGFLLLLGLGAIFGGLFLAFGYLAVRFQKFGLGAVAKTIQAAATGATGITLGWLAAGPMALIFGDAVGRLAGSISYVSRRNRLLQCVAVMPSFAEMKRVALKFRNLPSVSVPGGLVNAAGAVITPLGIYSYFSANAAGQFNIVERCIVGPLGILGVAISQVYMADLSKLIRERQPGLVRMFWVIVRRTLLAGVAMAVASVIFIPQAVEFVFGSEWAAAGQFARLLAPLFAVVLTSSAISMTLLVSGNQHLQLLWEVMRLVVMVFVWLLVTLAKLSPEAAVATHGLASVAMYVVYIWLSHFALHRCERNSTLPPRVA